jgi:inosine-uridine nucleoside N-ribohydrolase
MALLIETDIGRDLDDYLAICMLDSWGVKISAISVSPGDPDQLALVAGLRADLGAKWMFGPSVLGRKKKSLGGIHRGLRQENTEPDGWGPLLFAAALVEGPCDLLTIGPVHALSVLLAREAVSFDRVIVQGGFCSYRIHACKNRAPKFDGKETVSTFNLNGCVTGAALLLEAKCKERYFVGKNVCHTVVGRPYKFSGFSSESIGSKLFSIALEKYFRSGKSEKALHDVVAAVCYVDPSIGTWIRGTPYREKNGEWGTELDPAGDLVLVDFDYERFWKMVGFTVPSPIPLVYV